MTKANTRKYQLAISFATPQREYALDLYEALKRKRITRVFLFDYERVRLAGMWLPGEYEKIFLHETDRAIILLSKEYLEEARRYTRIEAQSVVFGMHDRIAEGITPPLFLIKFDDVSLSGYNPGYNYFDPHTETPAQVAEVIAKIVKGKKN